MSGTHTEWAALGGRRITENGLNSELANDILSGFLGCKHTDDCRTGGAFNRKDHLHETPPPRQPPVLDDPTWLLHFIGLQANAWVILACCLTYTACKGGEGAAAGGSRADLDVIVTGRLDGGDVAADEVHDLRDVGSTRAFEAKDRFQTIKNALGGRGGTEEKTHLRFLLDAGKRHLEHRDCIDSISAVRDEAKSKAVRRMNLEGGGGGRAQHTEQTLRKRWSSCQASIRSWRPVPRTCP